MIRLIACLLLSSLAFCSARPTQEDVTRVQSTFLSLRFRAPLSSELRGRSDMELFRMSCQMQNVRCDDVLEILKSAKPEFYNQLTATESAAGERP
ncbi:MAG: hypothetical protein H7A21_10835 [Spirochaetales bacterium]|nr:hypothetical protein [Leptospiraceae bacterium]MCP5481919.1 hypothetical protein [Spirochaetales bacterium]